MTPLKKIQEIEALGVANVGAYRIKVRQWSGLKGDVIEKRSVIVWIKVKSYLLIFGTSIIWIMLLEGLEI